MIELIKGLTGPDLIGLAACAGAFGCAVMFAALAARRPTVALEREFDPSEGDADTDVSAFARFHPFHDGANARV